MSFKADTRVFRWPSVLLLAAILLFCFIPGAGSVAAQTGDDHGNDFNVATALPLDSSLAGRIDPGSDRDVFKLDLSGAAGSTHVWIYTTGGLDTRGWLYDSDGEVLTGDDNTTSDGVIVETNFRIPWTLAPGVYYISVRNADSVTTGDYTVHAMAEDHGHYLDLATPLALGGSATGRIDPGFDRDVFKLDLSGPAGSTHVWIYTTGGLDTRGWLYDGDGNFLRFGDNTTLDGVTVDTNFRIPGTLVPSVYYVSVLNAVGVATGDYTIHAVADDHGHYLDAATPLALGGSAAGRIAPGFDRDFFELDLSGAAGSTHVWIYTTGGLDTRGWLYDSDGNRLAFNNNSYLVGRELEFQLRRRLSSGVYYILVRSWSTSDNDNDAYDIGDYALHAEAVTDPGGTPSTATNLNLDEAAPGTVDAAGDADYFRLDLARPTDLVVLARNVYYRYHPSGERIFPEPLYAAMLDSQGTEIPVNVYGAESDNTWIEDSFGPGTYYVKVTARYGEATYPVPYTIQAYEDTAYGSFIDGCEEATFSLASSQVGDPLYGCQWHLRNYEPGGEDINVEPVWAAGINGEGVNVAVVDDTMDYSHEDLYGNIDRSLNHDYGGRGGAYRPFDHHGTAVAGVIAARDNGIGVRGVAPGATIYGYNWLSGDWGLFEDINRADAMSRNRAVTAVSNNSWGPSDGPWLGEANRLWELAVDSGIREGQGGKGVFYVFAAGNGGKGHRENPDGTLGGGSVGRRGDDSNLDELANYHAVTAVCAVNEEDTRTAYSEKGANLWVCAPSKDGSEEEFKDHRGIVTTENSNRYQSDFSGTSASAPIVSGVAALLRQANPDLSWRDLKLILAASARKNDAGNPGWVEEARKYEADLAEDRYHFNHEYGFGMVDAGAALDLARGWTGVPPLMSDGAESQEAVTIPSPSDSTLQIVTTTLTLNTGMRFTEFVEINTDFDHRSFRDMEIELVSPSGAISQLTVPFDTRYYTATYTRADGSIYDDTYFVRLNGEFRFGSARHLGEDPNGEWTLRLADHFPDRDGTLRAWSIKVYGHASRPTAPAITAPFPPGADFLTVAWTAPVDDGGSTITAYDLRYIETDDDETVNANWEVVEDAWTTGSGPLNYTITGLTGDTQYDVQVRGKNLGGPGPWSPSAVAVTGPPMVPGAPVDLRAVLVPDEAKVELSWSPPASSGSAPVTGYRVELSPGATGPWELVAETEDTGYVDDGTDSNGPVFSVGDWPHYRVAAANQVGIGPWSDSVFGGGDPLVAIYDTNRNGRIDRNEVIAAINDYLFGVGENTISRADVIKLINLYLFG